MTLDYIRYNKIEAIRQLGVILKYTRFYNMHIPKTGGERDTTKRPIMAEVACEHSNRVILTSDNPRSEDPEIILNEMESGLTLTQKRKTLRIADRKEAIKTACSLAQPDDIILIAGKGHENYQEIKGVKYPFADKEILIETFDLLNK